MLRRAHKMRLAFRVTVDEKCRHGAKPCRIGDRLTLIPGAQPHADGNMTILSVSVIGSLLVVYSVVSSREWPGSHSLFLLRQDKEAKEGDRKPLPLRGSRSVGRKTGKK